MGTNNTKLGTCIPHRGVIGTQEIWQYSFLPDHEFNSAMSNPYEWFLPTMGSPLIKFNICRCIVVHWI